MRRYSDPVEVRSGSRLGTVQGAVPGRGVGPVDEKDAVEVVVGRETVDVERRSWWRDALDPVPGQPTGIDVASREQHVWRVEASRGQAFGTGVFDLTSDGAEGTDADWRLVRVAD